MRKSILMNVKQPVFLYRMIRCAELHNTAKKAKPETALIELFRALHK